MPGLDNSPDAFVQVLRWLVRMAVRGLAALMTLLIIAGVIDVGWTLVDRMLKAQPMFVLSVADMLATFGAFMAVLIAIEILINITLYLRDDVIHVKIVMATALMAIARKVIVLDLSKTSSETVFGIAAVVLATSIGYWLMSRMEHHRPAGAVDVD